MGDQVDLREESVRLAFARSASVRLTPGSLGRFAALLGRRAESDQDRQIAAALDAMPMEQVPAFLTEATPDGKRLREIAPFEMLLSPDEMEMIASGAEDPILEIAEKYKRRQINNRATEEKIADSDAEPPKEERTTDATHFYQPGDFIALEMGRLAAQRVTPKTLEDFKKHLEKTHERNGDSKYLRMWFEIVHRGPAAVRQAFTETSERGQVLRSSISFSAFVTKAERNRIFHERTKDGIGR